MITFTRRNMFGAAIFNFTLSSLSSAQSTPSPRCRKWIAYYGQEGDCETLSSYDIVVLDPAFQGSIQRCQGKGAKILGYISLGEISADSALFSQLYDHSAILSPNREWPNCFRVDVRNPSWRSLILEKGIPAIIRRGFSGVFFDTLDTPPYLEQEDPIRFDGMRVAAIDLVKSIRHNFPNVILAMNRGYDLLPDVVSDIDAVIAESFLTTHRFENNSYHWVEASLVVQQNLRLTAARNRVPPLPVLSLDYWDPTDTKTVRDIYRREREFGNMPYVSTPLLNQIIPEPLP